MVIPAAVKDLSSEREYRGNGVLPLPGCKRKDTQAQAQLKVHHACFQYRLTGAHTDGVLVTCLLNIYDDGVFCSNLAHYSGSGACSACL